VLRYESSPFFVIKSKNVPLGFRFVIPIQACILNSLFSELYIKMSVGVLGFDSGRGLGIFLFSTASRTALGLTQSPIQRIPGALFLGVKRPGREADHSPPFSAEVKE
jgi:hypothetical protein